MTGDEGRETKMAINLQMPEVSELKPRITVFGVGGAGGNAVNNMIDSGLVGCDFVVANTDAQALASSRSERVVQMGVAVTEGLGAGSMPEIGSEAAREVIDELTDHLSGAHMVFITAGMGGGTGTGAAPVIAQAARDMGILTVGVVTKPFFFEGQRRMRIAEAGIDELQKHVDTLIVIPNQNLFRIANEKTTFADAFAMADQVLYSGVACITDLMVKEGLINLDFADVRSIMRGMGKAMMGTGEASGDNRAIQAAEAAIANPLLDETSMQGARGLLISITGGKDMTLYEVDEAATRIREEVDQDANIILGATFDDAVEGQIRVSVVATGIDQDAAAIASQRELTASDLAKRVKTVEASATPGPAPKRVEKPAQLEQPLPKKSEPAPVKAQAPQMSTAAPARAPKEQPLPLNAPTLAPAAASEAAIAAKLEAELDLDFGFDEEAVASEADPDITITPYRPDPVDVPQAKLLDEGHHTPLPVDEPTRQSFVPPAPEAPAENRIPSIDQFPVIAQREAAAAPLSHASPYPDERRPMSLLKRLATGFNKRDEEEADESHVAPQAPIEAPIPQQATAPAASPQASRPAIQRQPAPAPRPQQAELDALGRQQAKPASIEDDNLEIPAFLRRQAN